MENKTRIIKMTSLAGEYMLLGRKSVDPSNIFVQYGQGPTRTVNLTGGPGVQEAEFVDGLRFNMAAAQPMTVNVDIPDGVDPAALPAGTKSISQFHHSRFFEIFLQTSNNFGPPDSFAWVMNSTTPAGNTFAANVVFPCKSSITQCLFLSTMLSNNHSQPENAGRKSRQSS